MPYIINPIKTVGNAINVFRKIIKIFLPINLFKAIIIPKGTTINYENLEKQDADSEPEYFSFLTNKTYNKQIACSVTYTNQKVHEIIKKNLKKRKI